MEQLATSSAMSERCARTVSSREKSWDSTAGPSLAWQAKQRRSRIGRTSSACVGGGPTHAAGDTRGQEAREEEAEGVEGGGRAAHAANAPIAATRNALTGTGSP
jgi:hypothetical protein